MPITEHDLDDLLTVDEAADLLQLSRATIYRMIADRELDVVRIGSGRGRARITRRALLDHLNRRVTRADVRRSPRAS
jgi:excisionase family DNA binding protein